MKAQEQSVYNNISSYEMAGVLNFGLLDLGSGPTDPKKNWLD